MGSRAHKRSAFLLFPYCYLAMKNKRCTFAAIKLNQRHHIWEK